MQRTMLSENDIELQAQDLSCRAGDRGAVERHPAAAPAGADDAAPTQSPCWSSYSTTSSTSTTRNGTNGVGGASNGHKRKSTSSDADVDGEQPMAKTRRHAFDADSGDEEMMNDASGSGGGVVGEVEHRLKINNRERKRMHDLNVALEALRAAMPFAASQSRKLSKISTLLLARSYVQMLHLTVIDLRKQLRQSTGIGATSGVAAVDEIDRLMHGEDAEAVDFEFRTNGQIRSASLLQQIQQRQYHLLQNSLKTTRQLLTKGEATAQSSPSNSIAVASHSPRAVSTAVHNNSTVHAAAQPQSSAVASAILSNYLQLLKQQQDQQQCLPHQPQLPTSQHAVNGGGSSSSTTAAPQSKAMLDVQKLLLSQLSRMGTQQ